MRFPAVFDPASWSPVVLVWSFLSLPFVTQRELATRLGVSLSKANYCLRALMGRGWVKVANFRRSPNKLGYAYLLTPKGIEEKARITVRFLGQKNTSSMRSRQRSIACNWKWALAQ